jgi:hypothetical protein
MLAALDRAGPDLWTLGEVNGLNNAGVRAEARAMLMGALRGAGVRLLGQSPARAMSVLGQSTKSLEGIEDDFNDDDLAA